jgi:hypothetical protein
MSALERMAAIDTLSDKECRFVLSWLAIATPGSAVAAALEASLVALADYRAGIARLRASAQQ